MLQPKLPRERLCEPSSPRNSNASPSQFSNIAGSVFRSAALSWVAGRYPQQKSPLQGHFAAAALAAQEGSHSAADSRSRAAYVAAQAASAMFAAVSSAGSLPSAATAAVSAVSYSGGALTYASFISDPWNEVRSDIAAIHLSHGQSIMERPLWSDDAPQRVVDTWVALQSGFPKGESWDVWIDW